MALADFPRYRALANVQAFQQSTAFLKWNNAARISSSPKTLLHMTLGSGFHDFASLLAANDVNVADIYDQAAAAAGKSVETAPDGVLDPETKALVGAIGFWTLIGVTLYAVYITATNFFRERQLNEIEKLLEEEVGGKKPMQPMQAAPGEPEGNRYSKRMMQKQMKKKKNRKILDEAKALEEEEQI
mmetsp:Transcript_8657/g.11235  ORF Transcript_8657/g.11235 Transcript_8657/m.11235 type:complete len:186 (+) Transcript_8657:1-558(+)